MAAFGSLRAFRSNPRLRQGIEALVRLDGTGLNPRSGKEVTVFPMRLAHLLGFAGLPLLRSVHSSASELASLQIKVPMLGESITDGTIAAILKAAGDAVEEDEPILQIETDKVTVDVRAPKAGVIEAILVKEDQNVNVGHVVASIVEGAAAGIAEGPPLKEAFPKQGEAPTPEQPLPAEQAPVLPPQHNMQELSKQRPAPPVDVGAAPQGAPGRAHIAFPPRRTPSGEVISMMPAEQALRVLHDAAGTVGGEARSDSAEPSAEQRFLMKMRAAAAARPPQLPRKPLSEWEMERIMLGGADD